MGTAPNSASSTNRGVPGVGPIVQAGRRRLGIAVVTLIALFVLAACGDDDSDQTDGPSSPDPTAIEASDTDGETGSDTTDTSAADEAGTLFPDVVGVDARLDDDGTWTFNVTLSSPYDSAARYADAWRVVGPDGQVYGERILLHDHAGEQPFTRSQSGIAIPDDVVEVTVEGRDQVSGWGGESMTVALDRG